MLEYLSGKRLARSIPQHFSNLFILHNYPPTKMEQTECSETSAYKIQPPGNYPEEDIQHSEHGESLKSRKPKYYLELGHDVLFQRPLQFSFH
jgi:hypothetical protein